ncbi:MAG: HAD family phosphatase [Paracoccaceae bacterium]
MTGFDLSRHRAAIFDLDGTLVQSEPAWEEAKRRILHAEGVSVPQATYDAFVGRGLRGFLTHVFGPDLSDDRRGLLANRIGAQADVLLPQMRQPVPGAARALRRLADQGLRLAVCSSSPRRHILAALDQLGVADIVPTLVSGADLPRGKPDPLPYLETLRLLDLPAPQAFAVEDALPGAQSAHAAGLAVIAIGPQGQTPALAALAPWQTADYPAFTRLVWPAG